MTTVLIANRGEIAVRIARSAHALGLGTVAVFTDADADAPHVGACDAAVHLPGRSLAETYLSIEALLDAAARSGATMVHPGYGFLSENADFARAVADAGLTWVGPGHQAIGAMGNKAQAKRRMQAVGVPTIPGATGNHADLLTAAPSLGLPLLVKAAAGGGGRGLRRIDRLDALPAALEQAAREARSSFGDGALLLERYVENGRHVEVQVLADAHGTVLHLGERDCSVQRRHQKVIEECPSPAVDAALRAQLGEAAIKAAKAVDYVGAGTVEMLLAPDGAFYFLEMNTRLQVEHPVTELVYGVDLVEEQLRIALGQPLALTQEALVPRGHAIEVRLYAENPERSWAPCTGTVRAFTPGDGLRVDAGIQPGQRITSDYDPMLAKLIAEGETRELSRRRLSRGLARTAVLGLDTNKYALSRMLEHPDFVAGQVHTGWLEAHFREIAEEVELSTAMRCVCLSALVRQQRSQAPGPRPRNLGDVPVRGWLREQVQQASFVIAGPDEHWRDGEARHRLRWLGADGCAHRVRIDGIVRTVWLAPDERGGVYVDVAGRCLHVRTPPLQAATERAQGDLVAPSAGTVVAVHAGPVKRGDAVVVLEAMKLELPVRAQVDGVAVAKVAVGDVVHTRQLLAVVEEAS